MAASVAALFVAGCASTDGDYPSLAIRDVERAQGRFTPAPPAERVAPLSPAVLQSITGMTEQARAAHARFLAAVPPTQRRIQAARGAAASDNRAIEAQLALSSLESLRSQTAIALGDVDSVYSTAAVEGRLLPPLEQSRATIVDLVADEDTTLAALRELLGG